MASAKVIIFVNTIQAVTIMKRLEIIPTRYFEEYNQSQPITLIKHFNKIKDENVDFGYSRKSSAVYSSMIEGNVIDLETYYKYYTSGMNTKTKSYKEISDLEAAYIYAHGHVLNEKNMLETHKLMSNSASIEKRYIGKYRNKKVTVNKQGHIVVYTGAESQIVKEEMRKLFHDITLLKDRKLTISQVFYYASLIHLIFVAIHPFTDGNGRTARLMEKWFLASMLGKKAWGINSEKLYLKRNKSYHNNINKIGDNYATVDYSNSIPFLKMLPMALRLK